MLAVAVAGCGGGSGSPGEPLDRRAPPASDPAEEAATRLDVRIDQATAALRAAAERGDRAQARRLERELDRLARRDAADRAPAGDASSDPVERLLDRLPFKRAPLFVQQVTSLGEGHELFVGVERAVFCLQSRAARRRAVAAVYGRADRFLRARRVRDFRFVLVALGSGTPSVRKALAIGSHRRVRLTARGRACRR